MQADFLGVVSKQYLLGILTGLLLSGCALSEGRVFPMCPTNPGPDAKARARLGTEPPSIAELAEKASSDDPQQAMQGGLNDFMYSWFYGQGLGESTVNVGTVVLFPPYALYLLLNAGLSLSGYERISPLSYVPGAPGDYARASWDAITSVPGRTTAFVADEPFQGEDPCIPK